MFLPQRKSVFASEGGAAHFDARVDGGEKNAGFLLAIKIKKPTQRTGDGGEGGPATVPAGREGYCWEGGRAGRAGESIARITNGMKKKKGGGGGKRSSTEEPYVGKKMTHATIEVYLFLAKILSE